MPASPDVLDATGRPQRSVKEPEAGSGVPARSARKALGETPTSAVKRRVNVPWLVKPTSRQIRVTGRSVVRSRNIARSTRRRAR